jgi:hypothetical protein
MSTYSQNDTLVRLEESYRILEKNLSSLIVKELKKQNKLKPHQRTWITESLIEDSTDIHLIFKIWVPKLVHFRQFLTSLRVAIEFIPTLNLDLDLSESLEFSSLISEFSQKLKNLTIKDEEIISYLKHIQSEANKLHSNFNKISIKAFCEYPKNQYIIKNTNQSTLFESTLKTIPGGIQYLKIFLWKTLLILWFIKSMQ